MKISIFKLNTESEKYWAEFIAPYLDEHDGIPKQNADAEKFILTLANDALEEGNIIDGKLNEANLVKFNKANAMAIKIFKNIKEIDFEPPTPNWSFCTSTLKCENFTIQDAENCTAMTNEEFANFKKLVDYFNVSPISETEIAITFTVNDVFEGKTI